MSGIKGRSHTPTVRLARHSGFTMVELMVTVAVLAILLAVAVPSFSMVRNSSRLASTANEILGGLQLARMEAIRRNAVVVFCQSANGTSCSAVEPWSGWIVATDTNRDGDFGDAGEILRYEQFGAGMEVRGSAAMVTTNGRVSFRPDGMVPGVGGAALLTSTIAACLPVTQPQENERRIHLAAGGRVNARSADTAGACRQPADAET